jgi:hypothetical protein
LHSTNEHFTNQGTSYGVDIDAVAGWLGSYGGEDSTSDISRGQQNNAHHIFTANSLLNRPLGGDNWYPTLVEAI